VTMTNHQRRLAHRSWPDEGAWVVGVDGSVCARTALGWAVANAPARATELHLVTAWQTPIYGPHSMTGPIAVPYDIEALEAAAHDDIEALAAEARTQLDVPVEPIVVHAGAATALLGASRHGALLVVGNRGRGGFTRLLLGSTSNQCATHAHVPTQPYASAEGRKNPSGASRFRPCYGHNSRSTHADIRRTAARLDAHPQARSRRTLRTSQYKYRGMRILF